MTFSFTGLAYLFLFVTITQLAFRYFQYLQKEKTKTAQLFFYLAIPFVLFTFFKAISGLFLAGNADILRLSVIIGPFLQGLSCAIALYLAIFILDLSRIFSWVGFIFLFILGAISSYLLFAEIPINPFLEYNSINWGIEFTNTYNLLRFWTIFLGFVPLGIVFFREYKKSEDPYVKARAKGFSYLAILIVAIGFFDFAFSMIFKGGPIARDILFIVFSIIFMTASFLKFKRPEEKEEKKQYE